MKSLRLIWSALATEAPVGSQLVQSAIRISVRVLLAGIVLIGIGTFLLPSKDIGYYFAARHDVPTSIAYACFLLAVPFLLSRLRIIGWPPIETGHAVKVALASVAVGLAALIGHRLVLSGFALSEDEFLADFDAQIFAAGRLLAFVTEEWRPYLDALQPAFRLPVPGATHWISAYLPMNAAIRAGFEWLGGRSLASPVLAAASVPILYDVCRQLFPGDRRVHLVAVLLFVTSSQFLLTAMTPYAMTAHVTLNLAWLWLVLRDRPWSHAVAVAVSLVACGLHQVVFHPLFVAPFLVLFWMNGRRWLALSYAIVLALGGLFWMSFYWPIAMELAGVSVPAGGDGLGLWHNVDRVLRLLRSASLDTIWLMAANIVRFLTWQNPLTFLLVVVACLAVRAWPRPAYALAGGIVVTILAMIVLLPYQGHGWGYRYLHGVLGNFALLAALGWRVLTDKVSAVANTSPALLWSSLAFSLFLLLPLRAYQAYDFSRPYAVSSRAIAAKPADIVIVDGQQIAFGTDLVRNDPFLQRRPIVLSLFFLSPAGIRHVCGRYRVALFDRTDAAAAGILRTEEPPAIAARNRALRTELENACPNLLRPSTSG